MLIRIEDPALGSVQLDTGDGAGMEQNLTAICHAVSLYSAVYDDRDRYDFLSLLYDRIKDLRNPGDAPKMPV